MKKNSKIRILFLIVQMEMGGSEKLVYNLVKYLDKNKFEIHVGWFVGKKILQEFKELGVKLHYIDKKPGIDFKAMLKLDKIIINNRIQIVNAQHFMPTFYSFYSCKIRKRAYLIPTFHSKWEIEERLDWKWKLLSPWVIKSSDSVIAISTSIANTIRKVYKVEQSKIHIIFNGVNIVEYGKNKLNLKKELGINSEDIIIGIVANLKKVKNHIFLLEAFSEIRKENKNVLLLIIGQGFEKDSDNTGPEIKKFIYEKQLNDSVLMLGYRKDVNELLRNIDIFCLSSLKEGLPMSIVEAMIAGLPVVGTNIEGIKDVIVHGETGLLVDLGDVNGLKNYLLKLINDKHFREKIGAKAKNIITKDFSMKNSISKYEDLFIKLFKS